MTNTIPNVPRELLADLLGNDHDKRIMAERHLLAMLANAPSPAGVDGLEVVRKACEVANCKYPDMVAMADFKRDVTPSVVIGLLDGIRHAKGIAAINDARANGCAETVQFLRVELSDAQAIIDGLRGEVADLHTTMMAAAVEIQVHWAAHCDEDGYGPANLMHRLERGIASQYGYSAETLVRLESQRDQHAQRIGELEGLLLRVQVSLSLDDTEWGYSGAEKYKLLSDIRAALSSGKKGE